MCGSSLVSYLVNNPAELTVEKIDHPKSPFEFNT